MSFIINWEKLDKKVALSVQLQINQFFAGLDDRPSFLGDISVESLDFGSVAPNLEIVDLTEPFPEFYMATEEDEGDLQPPLRASEDDMQLLAKVEYCGDMSIILKTELQLNYLTKQFVSLPVTLHITKIEFSALAVVAYLQDRVNFCFLEPLPPRTSLLDSFVIRTEIGDADHHVLKNVEKLEQFITEQLRKAIDEDFVFPSYHSFEIDD
ncbi:Mitochondrial distribution and morphology protein 12 [Coemansia sp. RSA 1813]|nr:Mitochondrial distribution and morphology protein 12 [Coemansia sp. RSA 1646]KAJ1772756.1 Mitochondrial distribution and morphology protein 12 [Coemansia sp. RSA 1843]KAJ2090707.1 Mitochondrial distribution and morphology protein 12 [Coemansia sp. RSA 986]KAJ2216087.1 Mitochondrial distribution and morphology protein 12 [Coemansia sp. RSA 487]KAJ2570076.1 Mitochondrial distribution and morphology protein 12 [Coemansia sp. RSA 1813]